MTGEATTSHVVYRAVLLAAGLLVLGLLFRQLVTLMLAVLMTVIIAIPLSSAATRLERRRIPRPLGALMALLGGLAVVALLIYLLVGPFIEETNRFADNVPEIVDDLEVKLQDWTGAKPGEVGDKVEEFVEKFTDDPDRLIGPITSIGLSVAGIAGALVLILITAYYMALRPDPLVEGLVSLAPPARRAHMRHVLQRLRGAWIGWMQGVVLDMLVTGVLLWIGLTIVGLDYAIFFAILTALLVVVPYFGAIAGAIPPVLLALTESPGKAAVVLVVYIVVQQVESNLTIPLIMSQTVRLHPAVIAIGVVVVGQLFGFVGLFVAVPILSMIVISVEEFWVLPLEDADRRRRRVEVELPGTVETGVEPDAAAEEAARRPEQIRPAS